MPLVEKLPVTPSTAQWQVWSTTARIVVTDARALPVARRIAERWIADVDLACSRFRTDSELMTSPRGRPVVVSPLLAQLVGVALEAARWTDGLVTPTIGNALLAAGYDRDWADMGAAVRVGSAGGTLRVRSAPSWRNVVLHDRTLTIPAGVQLDLGATGKAFTADLIAAEIARDLSVGVLVALGGDIATAGPVPELGWDVLVQDRPGDPSIVVTLAPESAIATSSTQGRRWQSGAHQMHHVLDPRTCRPAARVWRTASVCAPSCAEANALSTAALIVGADAPSWLQDRGVAARLVSAGTDRVVTVGGFPVTGMCQSPETGAGS